MEASSSKGISAWSGAEEAQAKCCCKYWQPHHTIAALSSHRSEGVGFEHGSKIMTDACAGFEYGSKIPTVGISQSPGICISGKVDPLPITEFSTNKCFDERHLNSISVASGKDAAIKHSRITWGSTSSGKPSMHNGASNGDRKEGQEQNLVKKKKMVSFRPDIEETIPSPCQIARFESNHMPPDHKNNAWMRHPNHQRHDRDTQ